MEFSGAYQSGQTVSESSTVAAEELEASLPRLRNASSLAEAANGAYEALSGDGGIIDALGEVVSSLQEVSGYDAELEGMAGTLGELVFPLEDASRDLRRYRTTSTSTPRRLTAPSSA